MLLYWVCKGPGLGILRGPMGPMSGDSSIYFGRRLEHGIPKGLQMHKQYLLWGLKYVNSTYSGAGSTYTTILK